MSKEIKAPKQEWPRLTQVLGSNYCLYSVVENKLETLYQNQEKLLAALKMVYDQVKKDA